MKLVYSVAALLVFCTQALAHQAPSGWQYPMECCHDSDCGVVTESHEVPGKNGTLGQLSVTTNHGTFLIPNDWKNHNTYGTWDISVRPSPDAQMHVCARDYGQGNVTFFCIFVPNTN